MKMANESTNYKLPSGVEAILRAQPLNPFVRMEFEAGEKSWSTLDPDSEPLAAKSSNADSNLHSSI